MQTDAPVFLVLGELRREFIITADGRVHLDQIGGNALYAAAGVKLWAEADEGIGLAARVGEDYPRGWLEEIRARGLGIEGIRVLPEPVDLRHFIAYSELTAPHYDNPVKQFSQRGLSFPRALLGYGPGRPAGPRGNLRSGDIPEDYRYAAAAHLCPMDLTTHSLLPAELRQAGLGIITLDPGPDYMRPEQLGKVQALLPGLSAFLPGDEDLRELFRGTTQDLWEMVEAIAEYGCDLVVVKRGGLGQIVYDCAAKVRYEIPAYPGRPLDVTGAGDAFAGGFLAGLRRTEDPVRAALYGSVAASIAVEGPGPFFSLDALPGLQQARLEALAGLVRRL
jgi:ribokinase